MNGNVLTDRDPFDGGPPIRMQKAVGLIKPDDLRMTRRTVLAVLLGWVVPALLASIEGLAFREDRSWTFLSDFGFHARFLIAVPMFIIAESNCIPRLANITHHFLDSGLVTDGDRAHFNAAVESTRKLINSWLVEVVVVILAYAVVAAIFHYIPLNGFPDWSSSGASGRLGLSAAGWWQALVSAPLLIVLLLGWLWRVFLWGRFLLLMSRLDLRLIPGHPDLAGGLKFINVSLQAFWPLGFALGIIVAGSAMNRIVHKGASLPSLKGLVLMLVIFVLVLFCGPLFVFTGKLIREKRRGIFKYGSLAAELGREFEHKWLDQEGKVDETALEVADFSATTDLYQIVSNVYGMWAVPVDYRNLILLIVATLLPFLPVIFFALPIDVILGEIAKLLF